MKKRFLGMVGTGLTVMLAVALLSCQTTKPNTAGNSIQTEQAGLAPNGDKEHQTIDFAMVFASKDAIKSWKVEMAGSSGSQKQWSGDAKNLPATLTWDGKDDSGSLAPEGTYTAKLTVDYGTSVPPATAESSSFVLDISPPTGSVTFNPQQFAPDEQGAVQPVTIQIEGSSPVAKLDSWSLAITDASGQTFRSFDGKWPSSDIQWDGKSSSGAVVIPGAFYTATATLQDAFGLTAQITSSIGVTLTTTGNSIRTEQSGLAPNGDKAHQTIDFAVVFASRDAIKNWKVEMVTSGTPQKQWSGDATTLPSTLTWEGKSEAGSTAPEGTYTAKLTVDYGTSVPPATAESSSFILDVSPPTGSVSFNPQQFTPDAQGVVQPVAIQIQGESALAKLDSWSLNITDPDGKDFRSFDGKWPSSDIQWDGKSSSGDVVTPGASYTATATLRDEFGVTAEVNASIAASPQVAVRPKTAGFAPNGSVKTEVLSVSYGKSESVQSWKLEILDSGGQDQRVFTGDGSNLPETVSWDGKNDAGEGATQGSYTAALSVDYGSAYAPGTATSSAFVLDLTPPSGTIALSEPLFSPVEGSPTITLTVDATSTIAKIDSWRMEINTPDGNLFKRFTAKWPNNQAVWDGKGVNGDMVQSAEDYPVVAKVQDEFGNVGELKAVVPVDILVEKTPTGLRILSSRIFFKPYTADYMDVRPDLAAQNVQRLNDMAAKLKKFPNYKIKLVGHAVMIHWDNKVLGDAEQKYILIPLSQHRAEAIKKAMMDKGLDAAMFTTEGVGASDQIVPDSDLANRWQNRRVAFFLER